LTLTDVQLDQTDSVLRGDQTDSVLRGRRGGLVIFPARMHEVQTCTRRGAPFTSALTRWMLGFQRRFVRRCEWLSRIPKEGCLPHMSQVAAMARASTEWF
jgi:hypothetical protein